MEGAFRELTFYPVGPSPRSYKLEYLVPPITIELMQAYRASRLMDKLAVEQFPQKAEEYDSLLITLQGRKSACSPESIPSGYRLIHRLAESIDDKLNVIEWQHREVQQDLNEVCRTVTEKGLVNIDLGQFHWKLLVDVESLLMFCRSLMDIFARLTGNFYHQMYKINLPESFTDQVSRKDKHKATDPEYFEQISSLSWFDMLTVYRDDLAHKISLKITIEPVANRSFPIYLRTSKHTLIKFEDIDQIVSSVNEFARYYVVHFTKVLEAYEPKHAQ